MAKNRIDVEIFEHAVAHLVGSRSSATHSYDEFRGAHRWEWTLDENARAEVTTVEKIRAWISSYKVLNGSTVVADTARLIVVVRPAK